MQMQLGLFVQSCRLGLHSAGTWGTARGQGAGALYSLQSHLGPSRMMAELGPEHSTYPTESQVGGTKATQKPPLAWG